MTKGDLSLIFGAALLVACVTYILVAIRARTRHDSLDDYFISNRTLSTTWEFSSFYASGLSLATVFIAFIEIAPGIGIQALWAPVTYVAGFFLAGKLAPLIGRSTEGKLTLHGYLGRRYKSRTIQTIASIVSTIAFGGRFATEIIVGSQILKFLSPNQGDLLWLIFGIAGSVVLCTVVGGFRSVVATDRLQAVMVFICCLTLAVISYVDSSIFTSVGQRSEYIKSSFLEKPAFPFLLIFNFVLINIPTIVVDMSVWQRLSAASSEKVAVRAINWVALSFVFSWTLVVLSALSIASHVKGSGASSLMAEILSFSVISYTYLFVGVITFCGLLAAMMSASDTFLIASSQTFVLDILRLEEKEKTHDSSYIIKYVQRTMIFGAILFFIFVYWLFSTGINIVGIVFIIYGTLLALFPATIVGLLTRGSIDLARIRFTCLASIISGFLGSWMYGVTAGYEGGNRVLGFIKGLFSLVPLHSAPENTPIVALFFSSLVFLIGSTYTLAIRRLKKSSLYNGGNTKK